MPILAVVSIDETGQRDVLAFGVGEREKPKAWEDLLDDLKARGVKEWTCGSNPAMLNAIPNKFPTSRRQRCLKLAYVPARPHDALRPGLKAIRIVFRRPSRNWPPSSLTMKAFTPARWPACGATWRPASLQNTGGAFGQPTSSSACSTKSDGAGLQTNEMKQV